MLTVTVVIPAYNAERTLGKVLDALSAQTQPVDEVIVVDDGSTDGTAEIAVRHGAVAVHTDGSGFAGAARNRGWEAASGDVVVFLDSDAIPGDGWGAGLRRALAEFPGAIVGCARTFRGKTPWGWVAHLQSETPYLPRGGPRTVAFVSSYCMAVPRAAPLRWDPSGGEDGIFCADAIGAGMELVFDPRYQAFHDHDRSTFAALRGQQRRLAYGLARIGPVQREGLHKRVLSRLPVTTLRSSACCRSTGGSGGRTSCATLSPQPAPPRGGRMDTRGKRAALRFRRPPLRGQAAGGFR